MALATAYSIYGNNLVSVQESYETMVTIYDKCFKEENYNGNPKIDTKFDLVFRPTISDEELSKTIKELYVLADSTSKGSDRLFEMSFKSDKVDYCVVGMIKSTEPSRGPFSVGDYSYLTQEDYNYIKGSWSGFEEQLEEKGGFQGEGWYHYTWTADEMGMMFTVIDWEKVDKPSIYMRNMSVSYIGVNSTFPHDHPDISKKAMELMAKILSIKGVSE